MTTAEFFDRELKVAYYNVDPRSADKQLMLFETQLKKLGSISIEKVRAIDNVESLANVDLLLVAAQHLDGPDFESWFNKLSDKMQRSTNIWIPALILSPASFSTQSNLLRTAAAMNWYFDIIDPEHIDSLPIRIANLLRIHDHLYELKRYEEMLMELTTKTNEMSDELSRMREDRS